MGAHENEKERLQEVATHYFLPAYAALVQKTFRLVTLQDRPDAILEALDGTRRDLEITSLFTDDEEAKILLGRSSSLCHGIQSSDEALLRLNTRLAEKERQGASYQCRHPMLLVIRVASPIFTSPDFERFRDDIHVPRGVFSETWLLFPDEDGPGQSRLMRLQ